jgi:hypothetical protein
MRCGAAMRCIGRYTATNNEIDSYPLDCQGRQVTGVCDTSSNQWLWMNCRIWKIGTEALRGIADPLCRLHIR